MKHIKQLLPAYIFGMLLLFTSCNKWLDVSPKTTVKEDSQFSKRQGFIDGLFGIYQNAAKPAMYGRNLTFGLLDILCQRYQNRSIATSLYAKLAAFNYTDAEVQAVIDDLFATTYSTIAQANYVLRNVDNGVLDATSASIVKGEAIGMRGFLHFELMRLFSDSYSDGANAASPSITYMKDFSVAPNARVNLGTALSLCEADLKAAEQLLSVNQAIDQIAGNQGSTNPDLFLQYRQNHLNYWAVKAALARLYQFKGDKVNALKYATEVIGSGKFNFVNQSALVVDPTQVTSDLTFSSEHIFSIYVSNLKVVADDVFKNTATGGETTDLWSTKAALNIVYDTGVSGQTNDIRSLAASKNLWLTVNDNVIYNKKYWSDSQANVKQRLIPVIKLAEMYYIAAESSPDLTEATKFFNAVRTGRLNAEIAVPASAAALETQIMLEYRKEFYGEGQLWHYFKRKNTAAIWNGGTSATAMIQMNKARYIFPLPNTELEFGSAN
ncbi:RagB/SusD family nutrient uptake outer membrane protein [Pedobacter frigoris]|uniref:RagB/SusD family nutrient uptake outer membrane protein n=1 Tax=Pedobacter frigoris TaxID=2571272 RepID=UPI00292CEB75|nr:RagB/SusD family nutrient uptake outer membrane protein [Pedobacter frigoris]